MLLLDYKQSLSFSHILFKVTWVARPSGKAASCKKWGSEHGGMQNKSIFCRYELTFSKNLMDLTEKTDC